MSENAVIEVVPVPEKKAVTADELMSVKQLPVIEEQLRTIKTSIEDKASRVLALECTEGTVKAIKTLRSDLNKDFKGLEERRKLIKNKVLAPYEAFEKIYKECVTDLFKSTDAELKKRIDEVENNLKFEKRKEIEAYFNEYAESKGVDFVTFFDAHINVTMSASKKSLFEQAKAFIDRISDDLALIDTQEYKAEILVEYKTGLNVSAAITSVTDRHKAIEAERAKAEQAVVQHASLENGEKTENELKAETAPLAAPKIAESDPVIIMRIGNTRIKARKSDCIILKNLLSNGRYEFIKN